MDIFPKNSQNYQENFVFSQNCWDEWSCASYSDGQSHQSLGSISGHDTYMSLSMILYCFPLNPGEEMKICEV